MAKQKVIGLCEAWWVWLAEQPAVRIATEAEAKALMLAEGKDISNSHNRWDMASPVAELLWNTPLPDGETFHKTVISPVAMLLHNGKLRKFICPLSPSKLASTSKGWYALEPDLPAWWPHQFHAAFNDPEVLVLRGKKPLKEQLDAKWPARD